MRKYLPRIGWERFECTLTGELIDPSNEQMMREAIMFRWAFVVGWGERVCWALAQPADQMQRLPQKEPNDGNV